MTDKDYIFFKSVHHLAEALAMCWHGTFPESIYIIKGEFGVPAAGFLTDKKLDTFERLAAQHGWPYRLGRVTSRPPGTPLISLVSTHWTYLDPYRFRFDGSRRDNGVYYDPWKPGMEYVLGARTADEARRLLDLLASYRVNDIRLVPVVLTNASPFEFFWLVETDHLPLEILQQAPRAWWGPAGSSSHTAIYLQWPYSHGLPDAFLQKLPWGAGSNGLVLLNYQPSDSSSGKKQNTSAESNAFIIHSATAPDQPFERFAELHVANEPVRLFASSLSPEPRFSVQLTLVRGGEPQRIQERIAALQREIKARQHLLETLDLQRAVPPAPEPLLIYYSEADPSQVPPQLRRLLVEWSDQPGDLNSIYYLKLSADSMPDGFDRCYSGVHAVTTAKALGMPSAGDPTVTARLLNYRPDLGARTWFDQLPQWASFGLRVFTPHGLGLRLYPELKPGEAAANQLTRALLSHASSAKDRQDSLLILAGNNEGGLSSCRIDAAAFQPIARAIQWECSISVDPPREWRSEHGAREAGQRFLLSLESGIESAAESEAQTCIERKCEALDQELQKFASDMATITTRNREISPLLAAANALTGRAAGDLRGFGADLNDVCAQLDNRIGRAVSLSGDLNSYNAVIERLQRLRDELQSLLKSIRRLENPRAEGNA